MNSENTNAIIVFTRYPVPGKVKTRLAAETSNEFACLFYKACAEYVFTELNKLKEKEYDIYIFGSDKLELQKIADWTDNSFYYSHQAGRDLGERMHNAFDEIFNKSYKRVVILGTDLPEVNCELMQDAFLALNDNDCVIGPANDGGYYLLGFKWKAIDLFSNVKWSSESVFNDTISKIKYYSTDYCTLKELNDIDNKKDLVKWYNENMELDEHPVKIFIDNNHSELF